MFCYRDFLKINKAPICSLISNIRDKNASFTTKHSAIRYTFYGKSISASIRLINNRQCDATKQYG